MYILLMNGYVASLKTTLSYLLAPTLQLGHITTSVMGDFTSNRADQDFFQLRDLRYTKSARIAEAYLNENVSVLLDGNYPLKRWRQQIYQLAHQYGVSDVISITCTCSRPDLIEQRLDYRRKTSGVPDATANAMDAFWGSIRDFEPIESDNLPDGTLPSLIEFDSGTFEVKGRRIISEQAKNVVELIQHLIDEGRLSEPLFTGLPKTTPTQPESKLWIALEGFGGTGKTTQAEKLVTRLRADFPALRIAHQTEFSDTRLGDFIRTHLINNYRFQIGSAPSGMLENLVVLADSIQRGSSLVANADWDISILDRYKWSVAAHIMALLPQNLNADELSHIQQAVEIIINKFPALPGKGLVFFLDCPVEEAVQRLEQRHSFTFSQDHREFAKAIYNAYTTFLAHQPNVFRINASQSEETVTEEMYRTILQEWQPPAETQDNHAQ
jgi:thymidylate kinase/predicted kinase